MSEMNALRLCAACSTSWLAYASAGPFFCPRCTPGMMTPEEQLAPERRHDCRIRLYGEPSWCEWVPAGEPADGWIDLRQLSRPELPVRRSRMSQIMPRFSYAKLNARR